MANDLASLKKRLAAIPKDVREAVQPALIKSGDDMARAARTLAPVDTGALKNSIAVTYPGQSTPPYSQPGGSRVAKENEVIITAGDTKARYVHLVEYGTSHSHAKPFFWPAYRLTKKRNQNRIKRAINKAVREGWVGK
ncbi:HK97-gp10 family putative phage morphogenesis protein [Methylocystis heyeri]|uniref:HK97 gp10 family phage protein n=1 Tax=Methylocystis heyeri TaxID=391905 RepID=A0A6B8KJB2_9HYPH|nr:HK97-gp10 family putative phage morphogenesis protein [Methylocystis heyeri]QGM46660.1 HK97 gp10 family phage protein [Methylocystis heyeri]